MSHRPRQNFRGCSALLVMAEDRNAQSLKVTLGKLGITPQHFDPQGSAADLKSGMEAADVAFIDTDMLDAQFVPVIAGAALAVVAVIGIESPSRLQRAFDIEPSAVLMKPVRSNGVYTPAPARQAVDLPGAPRGAAHRRQGHSPSHAELRLQ
jgi:AmiR/NasT family two-component response regulator